MKQGDVLLRFDINAIESEGYSVETPCHYYYQFSRLPRYRRESIEDRDEWG